MTADNIIVCRNGPVTTLIINRPDRRNALDQESADQLAAAFQEFDQDPDQKIAVLTGEGGNFCAGADLKQMAHKAEYKAWAGHPDGPLHKPLSKPIIAAVSGYAVAGGLGVALYCDIRIAEEDAVFGIFCRRWGVPMSDGTPTRLPRLIGMGPAMDMMLTGDPVTAQEALRLGLATRIVPTGDARKEAEALAARIASYPPIAMLADRDCIYEQEGLPELEALKIEADGAEEAKQKEASKGAERFANGSGRHGNFKD
jgi:enoyl-CoA hydratase/carnithine racemase